MEHCTSSQHDSSRVCSPQDPAVKTPREKNESIDQSTTLSAESPVNEEKVDGRDLEGSSEENIRQEAKTEANIAEVESSTQGEVEEGCVGEEQQHRNTLEEESGGGKDDEGEATQSGNLTEPESKSQQKEEPFNLKKEESD